MPDEDLTDEFGSGAKHGTFKMSSDRPGLTYGIVKSEGREPQELYFDERRPLGQDEHPSPVTHLFGSLAACQISVLSQCLKKARIDEFSIEADARVSNRSKGEIDEVMPKNTAKRIEHIEIDLTLEVPEEDRDLAERCLEVYDSGCIVGQSLRAGIDYTPNISLRTHSG